MPRDADLRPAEESTADYRLVIILVGLTQLVMTTDFSILSVALPSIARSFHLKPSDLSLLISAGAVPLTGFMILAGRLADLFGQRRCMLIGLTLFGAGSIGSALAPGYGVLIAARVIQSFGVAIAMPANFSLINLLVPEGPPRHRALGVFGIMQGLSLIIGLLLGGVLTTTLGWRSVFLINPPIIVAALLLTLRCVPKTLVGGGPDRSIDLAGAALITTGAASLLIGVSMLGRTGITPLALGLLAASLAAFVLFGYVESKVRGPLVPLSIFKRRNFTAANIIGFCHLAGVGGLFFLVSLFMQNGLKLSPLLAGFGMMPYAGAVMLAGQLAPRIMGRLPHRRSMVVGFAFYAAGMALLGLFAASGNYFTALGPWLIITAFGGTLSFMAMMAEATADVPEDQQGVGSAVLFTVQQVGTPLGATLALSILASGGGGHFTAAFLATAALVMLALVLSLLILRPTPAIAPRVERTSDPGLEIHPAASG